MHRCSSFCSAWLVALVLALSPILTAGPLLASAQDTVEETQTPVDEGTPTEEPTLPAETDTPEPTATVEEPAASETATDIPTETVTESPVDPTIEPTIEASPTYEPTATERATEPAAIAPTATSAPSKTATATATPNPTKTAAPTEAPIGVAQVEDLEITLDCTGDPERIRVKNVGAVNILLKGIATYIAPIELEPFAISRLLSPGEIANYQAGNAASFGTVLTTRFIFTNTAYETEGVRIATSVGKATKMCDPKPPPPPPPAANLSDLTVTLNCLGTAETIRVSNNGTGWATIKGFASYIDAIAEEPIATRRELKPGQTAIFQAGEGAKYGTILTKQYIFTNAAYERDGIRISTSVGKLYKACPAKPVPQVRWLEVNLSTQFLRAWYGNTLISSTYVSTGKPGFATPTGTYYVLYRYRTQTMSGCIQGECYYVPDVPWVQYFTNYGHALHGAYWHNDFGRTRSHGCINLPLWFAEWLWTWATYGTRLWIHY